MQVALLRGGGRLIQTAASRSYRSQRPPSISPAPRRSAGSGAPHRRRAGLDGHRAWRTSAVKFNRNGPPYQQQTMSVNGSYDCLSHTKHARWLLTQNGCEKQPVSYREGFRAPAGVRKSPRKEPAGGRRCDSFSDFRLFRRWRDRRQEAPGWIRLGDFVVPSRGVVGSSRGRTRTFYFRSSAWTRVGRSPEAECLRPKVGSCHAGSRGRLPVRWGLFGGPRGCLHRSNISMIIMRPPQHGHGGRKSSGSSGVSSSGGAATFSSSRAPCGRSRRAGRSAECGGSHAAEQLKDRFAPFISVVERT